MGNKYYSVVGRYGVAVFNSWSRVLKGGEYMCLLHCKGFPTFLLAEEHALQLHRAYIPATSCGFSSLKVNTIRFYKELRQADVEESENGKLVIEIRGDGDDDGN